MSLGNSTSECSGPAARSASSHSARWRWLRLTLAWLALCPGSLGAQPSWDAYNAGVEAYAGSNYAGALQLWQDLSLQRLPAKLQRPVWFQIGNAQFRLGEPLEQSSPEEAVELWRRSCDAYRSAIQARPRDSQAAHNLAYVQQRLARLTHRLGREALRAADGQPLDEAIRLLRASTAHLDEAASLSPGSPEVRDDRAEAWRTLREKLSERARNAEGKADDFVAQTNRWADEQAEREYREALADFSEAQPAPPASQGQTAQQDVVSQAAAQGMERVNQKLSQLLTRMGRREQKAADEQAAWNPDQALGRYEQALAHFQSAQEHQSTNAEAQTGEREVRQAMERLHVEEGKAELDRGKTALNSRSPQAAEALSASLSHFEQALGMNPVNPEAFAGAEEARRLLPEALNLAGRSELKAGDRAEPQSAAEALNHYQEAEKDFQQSLDLQPGQAAAQEGLREAREKAGRTREKAVREAEAVAKAGETPGKPGPTLESLLGQVDEKERPREVKRQRQPGRRDTAPGKAHADW